MAPIRTAIVVFLRRVFVNLLLFVLGLSVTAAVIGHFTPLPYVEIVTPKLAHYTAHGEEFDVLFLGSSRTYRQLLPEIFDQGMAEAGHPMKAFNLGVDGMRPPEDTFVLEQALAARTKPLRYVFVECNALRRALPGEDEQTLRAVYWHDWKRLSALFRRAFLADEKRRNWRDRFKEVKEALPDFWEHATHWTENSTGLGRGHTMLDDRLMRGGPPKIDYSELGKRRDGYAPFYKAQQMNAAETAAYEKVIAAMRDKPARADYADRVSQAELQEKRRLIEAAGGRMILIVPPYGGSKMFYPRPGPDAPVVLDFSDPDKFPELFHPDHRQDRGHTNIPGSVLYTRALVRTLLAKLPDLSPRQP